LTGKEFFFIQPGINPALSVESLVEFADNGLVLRRVAEENAEFAGFGHVGFPERGRMVKLYDRMLSSQKEGDSRETSRRFLHIELAFRKTFGTVHKTPRFIEMIRRMFVTALNSRTMISRIFYFKSISDYYCHNLDV
jgi:hypothetical protein